MGSQCCRAHDPTVPDETRFGSSVQAAQAGASEKPRTLGVIETMRRRVEDRAEEVLTPYFDALAHGEDVEQRHEGS